MAKSREYKLSEQQVLEARRREFDSRFTRFRRKLRLEELIVKDLESETPEEI